MQGLLGQKATGQDRLGPAVAGAAIIFEPITALSAIGGNFLVAKVLSRPATTASAARWARAHEAFVRKPTAATVSTLKVMSRNLSATLADQLGFNVGAEELMGEAAGAGAGR